MNVTRGIKALAAYIKREAQLNLANHLTDDGYFYYRFTERGLDVEVQGRNNSAGLESEKERIEEKLKSGQTKERELGLKKLISILDRWINLGCAPKKYQTKLAIFNLKDATNIQSAFRVTCLPTQAAAEALVDKLLYFADRYKPPREISESICDESEPSAVHHSKKTAHAEVAVDAWQLAKMMEMPIYVWSFDHYIWHYKHRYAFVAIGQYVQDYPHHSDFVILKAGHRYCVMHKQFSLSVGGSHTSVDQAIEAADRSLARHSSDYERAMHKHGYVNGHTQHLAILDKLLEQEGIHPDQEEASAKVIEFDSLSRKKQQALLEEKILASQYHGIH